MVEYESKNNLEKENIFLEEKKSFELTENITYTELTKNQQNELKKQLNPKNYHTFILDINLNKETIEKYKIGQKLYQPTEIYTTTKITKPTTNVRYLIFSKEFKEIPKETLLSSYKNIQLSTSGIINCFKVVDIVNKKNLTQISLLHYNHFEEIILNHHKTEIEEKILKKSKEILNEKYSTKIDLKEINYKIINGIGIIKHENELKTYEKDHVIFLLDVFADLLKQYNMDKISKFIEEYNITNIINVYQNSIDELKKRTVDENTNFDEEKQKIINAYKNTILNSIEISKNFKRSSIKKDISKNDYKLEKNNQINEISEILNIPLEKIEYLINLENK